MRRLVPWLSVFLPQIAFAQGRTLTVDIGTPLDFDSVAANLLNFLATTIEFVCIALFVVGALLFTVSRGKDDLVQRGKSLMIGSLTGLAIVLAAQGILNTVIYLLYS